MTIQITLEQDKPGRKVASLEVGDLFLFVPNKDYLCMVITYNQYVDLSSGVIYNVNGEKDNVVQVEPVRPLEVREI